MDRVSVVLAEDDDRLRSQLSKVLMDNGFGVLAETSDGRATVQLATKLQPQVVVLDFDLRLLNGIEAGKKIARLAPGTRLILITSHVEHPYVVQALHAGFSSYVLKSRAVHDLPLAIREARRGNIHVTAELRSEVIHALIIKTRPS